MKSRIMLVILTMLFVSSLVFAESGRIEKFAGDFKVVRKGETAWVEPKEGWSLNDGDRVRTGFPGSAVIALTDGSVLNLKENTILEITLVAQNAPGHVTVLSILTGKIKAAVAKRTAGAGFEVRSPTAVAAVKGTVFIVEMAGKEMNVAVLEGLVALLDLKREREVLIKENERASMRDNQLENPKEQAPEEKKLHQESFGGSFFEGRAPAGDAPGGNENNLKDLEDMKKELAELRRDLREKRDQDFLEQKDDIQERFNDAELGKVSTDVHGNRIIVEEYITRTDPKTILFSHLTKRDGGIDSMTIAEEYNKALPENYMDVKKMVEKGLWKIDYLTVPEFFLTSRIAIVQNTKNDKIMELLTLSIPKVNVYQNWQQAEDRFFFMNGSLKWEHTTVAEPDIPSGFFNFPEHWHDMANLLTEIYEQPYTNLFEKVTDSVYKQRTTFSDSTYLDTTFFMIDDAGLKIPENLYLKFPQTIYLEDLYNGDTAFKLSYEVMFDSPIFTRPIDLVLTPAMFREYYLIEEGYIQPN